MSFTENDIIQIESHDLTLTAVRKQIEIFETGIPHTNISDAATLNHGIIPLNDASIKEYTETFEAEKDKKSILKFVPASGAATRMFKFLFEFLKNYNPKKESINAYMASTVTRVRFRRAT